jgi:glucosamine--fructose-6-phosphate aminotransferase (isomerizing)
MTIKKDLIKNHNIKFNTQTDSEVIVQLISFNYSIVQDVKKAIELSLFKLKGTWSLVIMSKYENNKLYCATHGSPLLVGFSNDFIMISSEQTGFYTFVDNYICLENNDLVVLEKNNNIIEFNDIHKYNIKQVNIDLTYSKLSHEPYPYWMIKEIYEQSDSAIRALGQDSHISTNLSEHVLNIERILDHSNVKLDSLQYHINSLKNIDNLILLGCGTSLHAGNYSIKTIKTISGFNTVQIFDASEFTSLDIPLFGKTGLILLSQSGETKDLHRCITIAKNYNLFMIGVINVVDSLIAREVTCCVYLNAGREVAVASTKSFMSQVIVLHLIAIWFSQIRNINELNRINIIDSLTKLPYDIKNTTNLVHASCKNIASILYNKKNIFILGKHSSEFIAKEGALKIKEVGYINTDGYSSSSLKHGGYAIIEKDFPIIIISPNDDNFSKNNIIIEEIKSRNAFIIGISDSQLNEMCDIFIKIPTNNTFSSLLSVIPLQLISYEIALIKKHNPDYPRNLSKCVSTD